MSLILLLIGILLQAAKEAPQAMQNALEKIRFPTLGASKSFVRFTAHIINAEMDHQSADEMANSSVMT